MNKIRSRHNMYLVLFVFVMFAMPRLNVKLGPVPLYGIDVIAALMLYSTSLTGSKVLVPFKSLIIISGFLIIISEFSGIIYGGSVIDAVYISMRYFLAFSLAFTVPRLIQTTADVEAVLKGLSLGLLVTALLMILSSLPMTRWITVLVFSISNLEPSNAAERYAEMNDSGGVRGRTLIGVSILSGAFISIAWPLTAYLRTRRFQLTAFWSLVSIAGLTLAPMAIVTTYSRQAALGTIMVLLAVLVLPFSDLRSRLLRPVMLSVGFIVFVGAGSSLFLLERYENRVVAMFNDPLSDERESHRLLSYIAPFEHVSEHMQFLVIGAGSNNRRSDTFDISSFEENHSLVGAGYFAHGMISTLILVFMVFAALFYANWHRKKASWLALYARGWPRSIFLAYLPILPMAAFSPALGTNIRAMYVYMFLIGLLASLRNTSLMADLQTDPVWNETFDGKHAAQTHLDQKVPSTDTTHSST